MNPTPAAVTRPASDAEPSTCTSDPLAVNWRARDSTGLTLPPPSHVTKRTVPTAPRVLAARRAPRRRAHGDAAGSESGFGGLRTANPHWSGRGRRSVGPLGVRRRQGHRRAIVATTTPHDPQRDAEDHGAHDAPDRRDIDAIGTIRARQRTV